MSGKPWPIEDRAALRKHAGKLSASELGVMLSRTSWAIYHEARKLDVSLKKQGRTHHHAKYDWTTIQEVVRLSLTGKSLRWVGRKLSIPHTTVQYILDSREAARVRW